MNNLAQIYQITNNNINYLLTAMGIIVGALTFITSVVIAFFTIKHLQVDKEIQQYKNKVKQQSDLTIKEFLSAKTKLNDELAEIQKESDELKKMKDSLKLKSEKTDKDFEQMDKKIEKLKSKINFTEGQVFAVSTSYDPTSVSGFSISSPYTVNTGIFTKRMIKCSQCGQEFSTNIDLTGNAMTGSIPICPHCHTCNFQ